MCRSDENCKSRMKMMASIYMHFDSRPNSRHDPVVARFCFLTLVEPTVDSDSWSFRFDVAEINWISNDYTTSHSTGRNSIMLSHAGPYGVASTGCHQSACLDRPERDLTGCRWYLCHMNAGTMSRRNVADNPEVPPLIAASLWSGLKIIHLAEIVLLWVGFTAI